MPKTNAIPYGLLDLVGAEVQGRNPFAYSDEMRVTIDGSYHLLAGKLGGFRTDATHASASQTATIGVPDGEFWALKSWSFESLTSVTINDFEQWAIRLNRMPENDLPGSIVGALPTLDTSPIVVNTIGTPSPILMYGHTFENAPLLYSGTQLRIQIIARDTSVSRSTRLALSFYRFV